MKLETVRKEKIDSLLPLWNEFISLIREEFGRTKVKEFNWTHVSTINGFCLIVFNEDNNEKHIPGGCVFQISVVEDIFILYYQKKRSFYKNSKNETRVRPPVIYGAFNASPEDKVLKIKISDMASNLFTKHRFVSIDDFGESVPYSEVRNKLFTTIL